MLQVLEKILDDDHDMDDMYLGRRAEQAAAEEAESAAFAAADAAEQAELTVELAELAAEEAECAAEQAAQAESAVQLASPPLPGARLQGAPPAGKQLQMLGGVASAPAWPKLLWRGRSSGDC